MINHIVLYEQLSLMLSWSTSLSLNFKKKQLYGQFFMSEVQLSQGQSHFKEAVYFLPLSSQKFLALILYTLERWKAKKTLDPPSGFELKTNQDHWF